MAGVSPIGYNGASVSNSGKVEIMRYRYFRIISVGILVLLGLLVVVSGGGWPTWLVFGISFGVAFGLVFAAMQRLQKG